MSRAMSIPASLLLLLLLLGGSSASDDLPKSDIDLLEFPLNLEYLEAEFFSYGAFGNGLDVYEPNLTSGGPSPIGGQIANLSPLIRDIIAQFAYQEFAHVRVIKKNVPGFPRPQLDLSQKTFATVINSAFEKELDPPFNPYENDLNFLIASYVIPYVGLTGYVGANPKLESPTAKQLLVGLLGVEAGQDAVIRALLYERATVPVEPYGYTVAEFTDKISKLRNKLGNQGVKDEGILVHPSQGPEGKSSGNVLAGDEDSLSYPRTPEEILSIVYSSGKPSKPGGFYPKGADGNIAKSHLKKFLGFI